MPGTVSLAALPVPLLWLTKKRVGFWRNHDPLVTLRPTHSKVVGGHLPFRGTRSAMLASTWPVRAVALMKQICSKASLGRFLEYSSAVRGDCRAYPGSVRYIQDTNGRARNLTSQNGPVVATITRDPVSRNNTLGLYISYSGVLSTKAHFRRDNMLEP